jgi:ferredoxin
LPLVQIDAEQRSTKRRPPMPELDAKTRNVTYEQIELGYSEADAQLEAGRCLRCDLCIGCGMCELVCSETGTEALRMVETASGRLIFDDFTRPISRCIGCGACAAVCPTGAIRVEDKDGLRSTIITGTVVRTQPLQLCAACHKPLISEVQYEVIRGRLANDGAMPTICCSCKRIKSALAIMQMDTLEAPVAGSVK